MILPAEEDELPELSDSILRTMNRQGRAGTLILPADSKLVSSFSKAHGLSNSMEKAEVLKRGGCRWKEDVGPDMDFSDRRLATPTRQSSSRVAEFAKTLPGST
ncbi:uncharacterized protein N7483_011757 [Penicillium malachiteum]|uniref:uncharacterized protein n=1 Tax=Penicillium malachiteum TaxID=1324776 RepID=UPI002548BD47|nr:uncharacterized protein N7483_011757 [Penicillium malachiteum]KAJ5714576.1 hypothetical protein N7483_011757 [Penicillium malachiteum]